MTDACTCQTREKHVCGYVCCLKAQYMAVISLGASELDRRGCPGARATKRILLGQVD